MYIYKVIAFLVLALFFIDYNEDTSDVSAPHEVIAIEDPHSENKVTTADLEKLPLKEEVLKTDNKNNVLENFDLKPLVRPASKDPIVQLKYLLKCRIEYCEEEVNQEGEEDIFAHRKDTMKWLNQAKQLYAGTPELERISRKIAVSLDHEIQKKGLEILNTYPPSKENLDILFQVASLTQNSLVMEDIFSDLEKYKKNKIYQGTISKKITELIKRGNFITAAISAEYSANFMNEENLQDFILLAEELPVGSQTQNILKKHIRVYQLMYPKL